MPCPCNNYSIGFNLIIAMMHDRAACNGVAFRPSHSEGNLPYARRCWMLFSHKTALRSLRRC